MDITSSRFCEALTGTRFNGAMPFQAWIYATGLFFYEKASLLQWGHAFSGMDIGFSVPKADQTLIASMGPCLFRHGYATGTDSPTLSSA